MEATRFPLDYDTIRTGDVIPPERIESIMQVKRSDRDAYQFAMMNLKTRMQRDLRALNNPMKIVQRNDSLVVLTSAEATMYSTIRQDQLRRQQASEFRDLVECVRVADLEPDQLHAHERSVETNGRYLQAMKATRKELRLTAHKRTTPKMIDS